MFHGQKSRNRVQNQSASLRFGALVICFLLLCGSSLLMAQDQAGQSASQPASQSSQTSQTSSPPADNGKPKQDVPAEAGGPGDNVGPYAIPRKKAEDTPPPPPPPPKKAEDMPDYSLKVNVPLVNVDVLVTTKAGQFVPGLKAGNFRVAEDGVPQQIKNFGVSQAPVTALLLVEFASTNYSFMVEALRASYAFANTMKKDDWIAVEYYDMKPHLLVDFTQDKRAVFGDEHV
jgi:hypothetical protein